MNQERVIDLMKDDLMGRDSLQILFAPYHVEREEEQMEVSSVRRKTDSKKSREMLDLSSTAAVSLRHRMPFKGVKIFLLPSRGEGDPNAQVFSFEVPAAGHRALPDSPESALTLDAS
jgi:hypothetical protein